MARTGQSESRASGGSRSAGKVEEALRREMAELRARLEEAESTIRAIQSGEVDALIVSGTDGEKVFVLEGADYPYRVIVEVMNEGVVTLGADGGILSCNTRFAKFLKMQTEQILGKPFAGFAAAEDQPRLHRVLEEAAENNHVIAIRLRCADGTAMPVNLSVGAFEAGGLPALCVVVTDLTDTLAAAEIGLRLASIVETSNDAIVSKSLDNKILTWNAAAERIFGFSAQDAVGQPITIIVPRDRIPELEMLDQKMRIGERIESYETLRVTKSGKPIHVSLTISPLTDPNGNVTGASVIERDITERKIAEAELEDYHQHLEDMVQQRTAELETAKLEIQGLNDVLEEHVATVEAINKELESYSHSVSHDLRTPLRFVNRIAHLLLHEPGAHLSKNATAQVNMILQATGEMAHLIENLLLFSQASREPLKQRRVDLWRLFQEAVKELQDAEDGCGAEIVIQDLAPCQGDRTLLKEVAVNLMANALKFTRRRDRPRITIGCAQTNGETVYFVQDNGVGFDMADLDALFVPFRRLHKPADFEGTGIGLALVKRIIERHGGRIWALGEVDQGATFYFTLGKQKAG
jgi:PAS domain S-box-containing protein